MDPALAETIASGTGEGGEPRPTGLPLLKGAVLGRYVVVSELGRGAMGVVYSAYDPDLDRKVALKLLQPSPAGSRAGSKERARLLREGQALARLAHPNVVAVYDVGIHDDRVFIAMELVLGQTLRHWLAAPRPWREVLAMFVQAGRGLSAAHAAGIVHRDFKPDNALVGADGRARVVDFGLAHAPREEGEARGAGESGGPGAAPSAAYAGGVSMPLESEASQGSSRSLVGTPQYMSLEQLTGERVTPAADQFAFCVSLWEALYGQAPYEAGDLLTLLSTLREGKVRDAPSRGVPGHVRQALLRGLSPSPASRHASMDALLAALERDPARARGRALAAAGVAALVVAAAVSGRNLRSGAPPAGPLCPSAAPQLAAVWSESTRAQLAAAFRATRKPFAEDAIAGATSALDAYGDAWVSMRAEACEASRIRGEQSSDLLDLRMQCLGDRLATMRALVGALTRVGPGDTKAVQGAVQAASGLPAIADCANVRALRGLVPRPADPAVRERIQSVRDDLAQVQVLLLTSRMSEARAAVARDVATATATGYAPVRAEALLAQGRVAQATQDMSAAVPFLDEAVIAATEGGHEDVEFSAWTELVRTNAFIGRWERTRDAGRHAHALLARSPDDERLFRLLRNEGFALWREGKLNDARATLEQALSVGEAARSPEDPVLRTVLLYLANVLYDLGLYEESLVRSRRALALLEHLVGPAHPDVAAMLQTIGNATMSLGDATEAEALYQQGLDLRIAALGADSPFSIESLEQVGLARLHEGRPEAALEVLAQAVDRSVRVMGPENHELGRELVNLGDAYVKLHRWDEAMATYVRALALVDKTYSKTSWYRVFPLQGIGRAFMGKKQLPKALAALEDGLSAAGSPDAAPDAVAGLKATLALALHAAHQDPERARTLADQARQAMARAAIDNRESLAELAAAFPPASTGAVSR